MGVAAAVPTGFPVDSMEGGLGVQPPSLVPYRINCGQDQFGTPNDLLEKIQPENPEWEIRRLRRRMNWRIAAALHHFADTKEDAWKLDQCARRWMTGERPNGQAVTEAVKFCNHRLCPICRVRRAMEWMKRLAPIYRQSEVVQDDKGQSFYGPAEFTLDGNGLLVRSEAALVEARRKFAQQAIMDADMGKPERTAARADKLDRMAMRETVRLYPRFITLTIRNIPHLVEVDEDGNVTRNYLDEALREPFKRLRDTARRRPDSDAGRLWALIKGGLYTVEVTYNSKTTFFHPHLHLVIWTEVAFLHNQAVENVWKQYGGGEEQEARTDTRKVSAGLARDAVKDLGDIDRGGIAYILGGMAKHLESDGEGDPDFKERRYPREFWHELALATAGRHLVETFGFLQGLEDSQVVADYQAEAMSEEENDDADESQTVGMHVVRQWVWRNKQYVIRASWPASAEDPIMSMEARLSMLAGTGVIVSQLDRQAVSRSWTEFANIAAWNTG
jgi:hypothetical protein